MSTAEATSTSTSVPQTPPTTAATPPVMSSDVPSADVTTPVSSSKSRRGGGAHPGSGNGGKAWTEEEEVYLLQMRLERVAYKKIAEHLCKTDLACRLHYHQLSHGGNRRKRNSPKAASSPTVMSLDLESPRKNSGFAAINTATGAIQKAKLPNTPGSGKPLLPKPAKGSKPGLRVNCTPDQVDRDRLVRIVASLEPQFWAQVAIQYGDIGNGEVLKRVYQHHTTAAVSQAVTHVKSENKMNGSQTPPTPAVSPNGRTASPVDERNSTVTTALSPAATETAFSEAASPVKDSSECSDADADAEMEESPIET